MTRIKLARYKKTLAAVLAGAAVWAASIPLDADPRLTAAGNLIIALAVLLGPANAPPPHAAPTLFAGRRVRDTELPRKDQP